MIKRKVKREVIRKIRHETHEPEPGHGVWKLAYADLMTGMMAFFMFLWILNNSSEEQVSGLSQHFAPVTVSESKLGIGKPGSGYSINDKEGSKITTRSMQGVESKAPRFGEEAEGKKQGEIRPSPLYRKTGKTNAVDEKKDPNEIANSKNRLVQLVQEFVSRDETQKNIALEPVERGLRIHLLEGLQVKMFAERQSAIPTDQMDRILRLFAIVLQKIDNRLIIEGHTQEFFTPRGREYTSWELSAERATNAYKALVKYGVDPNRFVSISGLSSRDLLLQNDANNIVNNRISLTIFYEDE